MKTPLFVLLVIVAGLNTHSTPLLAQAPIPVHDKKHDKWSKVIQHAKTISTIINTRVTVVVRKMQDAQEFISKAHMIVNNTVQNVKMVNHILKIKKEIEDLVNVSINAINEPRDNDLDGIDDLHYLNKWKHIQILLAIAGQADNVFELFKNVVESDRTIMDDKGRLSIIKDAYEDARKIRTSLRIQLRRINQEIYAYQRQRREVLAFEQLFSN